MLAVVLVLVLGLVPGLILLEAAQIASNHKNSPSLAMPSAQRSRSRSHEGSRAVDPPLHLQMGWRRHVEVVPEKLTFCCFCKATAYNPNNLSDSCLECKRPTVGYVREPLQDTTLRVRRVKRAHGTTDTNIFPFSDGVVRMSSSAFKPVR